MPLIRLRRRARIIRCFGAKRSGGGPRRIEATATAHALGATVRLKGLMVEAGWTLLAAEGIANLVMRFLE